MAEKDGLEADAASSQTVLSGGPSAGESQEQTPEGSVESQAEGSVTPKWTEQLPREYRDTFANYESYKDFVAAAAEAIPLKSRAIVKPADDAPPEEWESFFAAVGRPEDPSGYELDGDGLDKYTETAHKLGLTKQQARQLYEWFTETSKESIENQKKAASEAVEQVAESLKKDWGDSYEANMKAIDRFKKRYGSEELAKELNDPAVGNNVALIKALAKAGADLAPETLVEGGSVDKDAPRQGAFNYGSMKEMYPARKIRRR